MKLYKVSTTTKESDGIYNSYNMLAETALDAVKDWRKKMDIVKEEMKKDGLSPEEEIVEEIVMIDEVSKIDY